MKMHAMYKNHIPVSMQCNPYEIENLSDFTSVLYFRQTPSKDRCKHCEKALKKLEKILKKRVKWAE